jgi:hypothetical protein
LDYLTYEVSIFQLLKSYLWELHVFHEEKNVCHLFAKCFKVFFYIGHDHEIWNNIIQKVASSDANYK